MFHAPRRSLDRKGKVNDVYYSDWDADEELLKIPALLAREEGVTWETDPDQFVTPRHHYLDRQEGWRCGIPRSLLYWPR